MLELTGCLRWVRGGQDGADYGNAGGPGADDVGGAGGVDASDAEVGDGQGGGQFLQELNTLGCLVRMGAGGEDGAGDDVVGALMLGVESAPGTVDGAADDE